MASYSDWAVRWRVSLHFVLAVVFFAFAQPAPDWLGIGGLLVVLGLAIRAWAAGHLRRDSRLTLSGPYTHLRHPLYLGTAVILAGFALAGWSLWLAVLLGSYFVAVFVPVMLREERDRRGRAPDLYAAYAARVPAFLPRLRPAALDAAIAGRFDFATYLRNQEWRAVLGCGLMLFLVWAKMRWG